MKLLAHLCFASALLTAAPAYASDQAAPVKCSVKKESRDAAMKMGKRFTVHIEGNGPDVILIPGLSTPREVWKETIDAFAGCYTMHTVQLRGFGDDPGINAEGPILDQFALELADYIDDEIVNKGRPAPAIVGHSLGGLSALMIGARYPDLAGKIMVVDAVPFIGTIFNPAATVEMVKPQAEAMAAGMRATYGKPQASVDENADPGTNSQAGFWSNSLAGRKAVAQWSRRSDPRVVAQAFYDDMTTDMRGGLPKITAPVTLLYAQDDSAMTAEAATKAFVPQYAGTPKFEAKMISGSRHFIMLDQPDKFGAALTEFLK